MIVRIFAGLFLTGYGVNALGWANVDPRLLGVLALVGGIAWLAGF